MLREGRFAVLGAADTDAVALVALSALVTILLMAAVEPGFVSGIWLRNILKVRIAVS